MFAKWPQVLCGRLDRRFMNCIYDVTEEICNLTVVHDFKIDLKNIKIELLNLKYSVPNYLCELTGIFIYLGQPSFHIVLTMGSTFTLS